MSNIAIVEQAKKEAKRLLRLAKHQNGEQPHVPIRHLHEAKDVVAKLQGYPSWRAFEDAKLSGIDTSVVAAIQSEVHSGTSTAMETLLAAQEVCVASDTSAPTETVQSDLPADTLVIDFIENFKKVSANNCFKYRTPNETYVPYVKQKSASFVLGTKSEVDLRSRGFRKIFGKNQTIDADANISLSTMCTHFLVSGSNYTDRANFLSNMAKTQINNGNPLIYFDGCYDTEMVKSLYVMLKHIEDTSYSSMDTPSRLRVLSMCAKTTDSIKNLSSIDPFEELTPDALCTLLLPDTHDSSNMWWYRAYYMLLPIIQGLYELKTRISMVIDVPTIEFAITFEGMSYLLKHPFVSKAVKHDIYAYLERLPGNRISQIDMIIEPRASSLHGYLTMQISPKLALLRKGYNHGYFSITPTDSFQNIISHHMVFYVATDVGEQSQEESVFLMSLVNHKLEYLLDKPQNRLTHTDNSLGLLIFDDCLFDSSTINLSSFFSRSRALGYSCIISSYNFIFEPYIYANTASKVIFNTSESELKAQKGESTSTILDFVNLFNQPDLESELTKLKSGEFYYFNKEVAVKFKSIKSDYLTHDSNVEIKISSLEPLYSLIDVDPLP